MSALHALLLGIIEGLTEFLPISSTGHMILLGTWLGDENDAAKTFEVVIQLGAMLAVVMYYRARIALLVRGLARRDPASVRLALAVVIAFIPAAAIGVVLHSTIERVLFGPVPVAAALIVGGIVMIAVELFRSRKTTVDADGMEHVTPRRALTIGLAQCFSLWPGASRSMSTIVGGQLSGLTTSTAADFSFFLAIPTLGAATLFKLAKGGGALLAAPGGLVALVIGSVTSFVVALVVIAAFLGYLKRYGLLPFGVYRIVIGVIVLLMVARAPAANATPSASATAAPAGTAAMP